MNRQFVNSQFFWFECPFTHTAASNTAENRNAEIPPAVMQPQQSLVHAPPLSPRLKRKGRPLNGSFEEQWQCEECFATTHWPSSD